MILFETAKAAGVIESAPSVGALFSNILFFLLSVVGIVGILGMVFSGFQYLFSFGDAKRVEQAKASFRYSVIGILVALGALILLKTIEGLLRQ